MVITAKASPNAVTASPDQRGRKVSPINTQHDAIDRHIKSYNPCISHYRREHTPNRLYLPHGLTVKSMHENFKETNTETTADYTTYLRRVNALNISFAQLGEEEWEVCIRLERSTHSRTADDECDATCEVSNEKKEHLTIATEARNSYKSDGAMVSPDTVVRSVDLQKVVMLPRLPGLKTACFTRRLVAFHLMYAPIGKYTEPFKPISVLWHEGISGRKCEDITSAVMLALFEDRDSSRIIHYMDNCAG